MQYYLFPIKNNNYAKRGVNKCDEPTPILLLYGVIVSILLLVFMPKDPYDSNIATCSASDGVWWLCMTFFYLFWCVTNPAHLL